MSELGDPDLVKVGVLRYDDGHRSHRVGRVGRIGRSKDHSRGLFWGAGPGCGGRSGAATTAALVRACLDLGDEPPRSTALLGAVD